MANVDDELQQIREEQRAQRKLLERVLEAVLEQHEHRGCVLQGDALLRSLGTACLAAVNAEGGSVNGPPVPMNGGLHT